MPDLPSAAEPGIPTFEQPGTLSVAPDSAIEFAPDPLAPAGATSGSARPENYAVVGLLELGEQSAALVRVDGTTQRYALGESVGNSGWRLAEVAERRAVFRRGGSERMLGIGDTLE